VAKKKITNEALLSWTSLNDFVMKTEDEKALDALLQEELKGRKRKKFAQRIHSRINKIRADRERTELESRLP